ncbi:sensor histidine kinase [Lacibacterium aquatile]|uniref:histidine kinase n=1 Tax=Lacibacterium aquatile TaxID=1168082 RepID=A0ABW5DW61_9PROT
MAFRVGALRRWVSRPVVFVGAFAFLCLVLFWGVAGVAIDRDRRSALKITHEEAHRTVLLMEGHALRTFDGAQLLMNIIEQWLVEPIQGVTDMAYAPPLDLLDARLDKLVAGLAIDADVRLFAANGHMIPVAGKGDARVSAAGREYFQTLMRGDDPGMVIGVPLKAADTGSFIIPIAKRVADNPYGVAVIALGLPVRIFSDHYASLGGGRSGSANLYRRDGALLTPAMGPGGQEPNREKPSWFPTDVDAEDVGGGFLSDPGHQALIAYRFVDEYPLVAVAYQPLEEALAGHMQQRTFSLILVSIATAVVLLGAFFLLRLEMARDREGEKLAAALMAADAANAAKSDFLARMSHELRTPLNAILGFSEIIAEGMFGAITERYRDYASDIRRSGKHLLSLINDILDIARIEAGKHPLLPEALEIAPLVAETSGLLAERARLNSVVFDLNFDQGLPLLWADRRAVVQMLLNLCGNAVKFAPPRTVITIAVGLSADGGLAIDVIDQGPGISAVDLPRVTEPFGAGQVRAATATEGTGLGLAITKGLIALHGGQLELLSPPGAGVTARLVFPAARLKAAAVAAPTVNA